MAELTSKRAGDQLYQMEGKLQDQLEAEFDPEGGDYDMKAAKAAGLKPDETGHWPSRDPKSGMILKGRKHPTWSLTVAGEDEAGMEIVQRDGRYYSIPKKIQKRFMSPD